MRIDQSSKCITPVGATPRGCPTPPPWLPTNPRWVSRIRAGTGVWQAQGYGQAQGPAPTGAKWSFVGQSWQN